MSETVSEQPSRAQAIKEKALHEARDLFFVFCYLFATLGLFALYGALMIYSAAGVKPLTIGFVFMQAFIGAKVIVIAQHKGFTKAHEHRPLLWPTLYKSTIFMLLMIAFNVVEKLVDGALHHDSIWHELTALHVTAIMAKNAAIFVCLIPFFAFREIERVQGERTMYRLFINPGPTGPRDTHP